MAQFNKVFMLGNLVRDVDVRYSPSGTAVGAFALAVNERSKSGNEWKDEVSFFDVKTFGKTAESCANNLSKGSPVLISGRLKQNRWEQDGAKRSRVEILADNVQFLGKRQEKDAPQESPPDDDIPF